MSETTADHISITFRGVPLISSTLYGVADT
jgi:hypothetical protein